ncbi:hypothetical protein EJB05_00684, partial [Eragrostis curvula]
MGAMEAALVSGILKIVGTKLAALVTKDFSAIAGVKKELEDLQDLVDWINDWLEKVGDKAISNQKSSNWLNRLKDAAYDAEDLVYEFHMEAEKLAENAIGVNSIVMKYLWTRPKSVVLKHKIAHKIKETKKRFDAIVKGRSDYSTITNKFSVEKLVEKLFEAIDGDKADHHALQRMSRTISNKLAGKKFLIVMDDVWTEDHIQWEQFMVNVRGGAPGSSILLTTRNRKVAEAVDSTCTCDLPFLSKEDSWKVFLGSFGRTMEGLDHEFQQVGTEIVKKCGGVPLAIKVLSGVIRGMKRIEQWQSIRDNNLLDVEDEQRRVSNCLFLSYVHLPYHLKHCFTHCSIFPRGYKINRRHLISQWISHGFINLTNEAQQPEDVGIDYFEYLLNVGFLQDLEHQPVCGEEITCKMHDLIHDLSRQILHDEFVSGTAAANRRKRYRYLSLTSCTGKVDSKLFDKVRALYVSRGNLTFDKTINKRSCVRIIAIHIIDCRRLATLPESIGKLKKLRTLELKGSLNVSILPEPVGGCNNLQNLYLHYCGLEDIPNSVANIDKLRVLSIVDCYKLKVQQLLSLEIFGDNTKHAKISEIENLDKLNGEFHITNINNVKDPCDAEKVCLKKKIGIRDLSLDWYTKVPSWVRDTLEESVEVRTEKDLFLDMEKDLYLLNNLEPPSEVEKLRISGYHGSQLPCWMIKKNHSCDLDNMHIPKQSNPLQFSHLTELVLENLSNLEHMRGLVLPRIKILELRKMPKLLELLTTTASLAHEEEVEAQYCFPHLSDLLISDCPKLIVKPCFPLSLKRLTLEASNEQLLSSGSFVNPRHADDDESTSSFCIVDVKPPHLTELNLGRPIGSSCSWKVLQHLTGLQVLEIYECKDLRQLPESMQRLTCLRTLMIRNCYNICMLPEWIGELQCLESLSILGLPKISILPQSIQHLTALQELHIIMCDAFQRMPEQLGELRSLRILAIVHLPALTCLPECMQHLISLQQIILHSCDALTRLPESLGELYALRRFWIQSCQGLTSLPRSIQCLSALEELKIDDCPELVRRCKEGDGEDWYLVSHIPDLILMGPGTS